MNLIITIPSILFSQIHLLTGGIYERLGNSSGCSDYLLYRKQISKKRSKFFETIIIITYDDKYGVVFNYFF